MKSSFEKKFFDDGYLTLKNFLSSNEKSIIKEVIYENFKKNITLLSKSKFDLEDENFHKKIILFRKKNPKKFGETYDNINLNSRFRSIFHTKKYLNLFAKTLNTSINQIHLTGFMMRFDTPYDKRNNLGWHQDASPYMQSAPKFRGGVCWCPVTNNSEKNGTVIYVPKSHSKYIKAKATRKKISYSKQYMINLSKKEFDAKKNLTQNFGDLALLHINIKHRSGENSSNKVRITTGVRFADMSKSFNSGKEHYIFNQPKYQFQY